MKSAIYCPDEYIVRQGTTPKGLFLITRGMVHVLKGPPAEADEGDEGDSSPDRSSCRVSFESDGRSSAGPRARSGGAETPSKHESGGVVYTTTLFSFSICTPKIIKNVFQ